MACGLHDHHLGKITIKHCHGKSYRKRMFSYSLHRSSSHLCFLEGHIIVSIPDSFWRPSFLCGESGLPLQPKIQVCDPPPDHLVRLNSSQVQHCCSLCRGSEGQARSTQLSNSNTKPGTPAGLMVFTPK